MEATVGVESDMDQGSTFWFELPVKSRTARLSAF